MSTRNGSTNGRVIILWVALGVGISLGSCGTDSSANKVGSVSASSYYDKRDSYKPENVSDGDEQTEWAAQGSEPASLAITPLRAGILQSIRFVARQTSLWEAWYKVEVKLYLKGQSVSSEVFSFPSAATQRVQEISLRPVECDRIELLFSEPVTETPTGQAVKAAAVNPGYSEIVLNWKN